MTREQWTVLAERCEAAARSDDELDEAIFLALGWKHFVIQGDHWRRQGDDWLTRTLPQLPETTGSIDAITALIERELPGWAWYCAFIHAPGCLPCNGDIWRPSTRGAEVPSIGPDRFRADAATPALALCAAFCRAMAERTAT